MQCLYLVMFVECTVPNTMILSDASCYCSIRGDCEVFNKTLWQLYNTTYGTIPVPLKSFGPSLSELRELKVWLKSFLHYLSIQLSVILVSFSVSFKIDRPFGIWLIWDFGFNVDTAVCDVIIRLLLLTLLSLLHCFAAHTPQKNTIIE